MNRTPFPAGVSTMPAVVACPKCQTKYQLPDHILGKPIKCKSCGAAFQTKSPSGASSPVPRPATAGATGNSKSTGAVAQGRKLPTPNELAQLGIDGPLRRQPDVFAGVAPISRQGPDLLGNHAADPGFGEAVSKRRSKTSVEDEVPSNDQAEFLNNPALHRDSKKKNSLADGGNRRSKHAAWHQRVWIAEVIIFPALLLLILLLMWAVPGSSTVALIVYIALVSATLVGVVVWNLIDCARFSDNTAQFIMVLLVPFYAIYFWIKHWDDVWRSTMAHLVVSLFVIPVSCLMILLFAYLVGPSEILGIQWNK